MYCPGFKKTMYRTIVREYYEYGYEKGELIYGLHL